MSVEYSEYMGHPTMVLRLNDKDKFPMTIGLKKARLITMHAKEIADFYIKHKGDKAV